MPTYDYICPNGHRFEVMHGVAASGPDACPICGASPVRKAFSAPSIHFKGSGWAKKDRSSTSGSRSKTAGTGAGSTEGSSGDGAATSSGSSETKSSSNGASTAATSAED